MLLAMLMSAAVMAAAPQPTISPTEASAPNPRAIELFDGEPILMHWALHHYDANGDGWLTSFEVQRAADAFRLLADSNGDGRVTPTEYRDAVAFVAARY